MSDVVLFRGHKHPLSNMYPATIYIWNIVFPTSEHAYQYKKAMHMKQFDVAAKIRGAGSPYEAMRISRQIKLDQTWHRIKLNVMYQVLQAKFLQCKSFREYLYSCKRKGITEDTHNYFWGRGRSGRGLNWLGKLLVKLRDARDFQAQFGHV